MRNPRICAPAILIAWLAFSTTPALAQPGPPHHHRHHQMTATRYDPATEISAKGTVEIVEVLSQGDCPDCTGGVHLVVESEGQNYDVHLGPSSFLEAKDWRLEAGDEIQIVGSKVAQNGTSALLAREISKDGRTLVLRNPEGVPLWSRGRAR